MPASLNNGDEFTAGAAAILEQLEQVIVGKREVLRMLLAGFLCSGGHILIEDYPGLAKTLIANSFARVLGLQFKRLQCTPDLLPADVTGGYIVDPGSKQLVLRYGPIFTNILLADEVNRASPKTQSALLEAMQEYQVTVEGETLPLPEPFIVIATQNPIEFEGTFPLPEAQLDRFLMRLRVGYPEPEHEQEILERRRLRGSDQVQLDPVSSPQQFGAMRAWVEGIFVEPAVERYIVDIVAWTRDHPQVAIGSSPRGSLALMKLCRAWAAMEGRSFVTPDDVKRFAHPVLGHRLILEPKLWGSKTNEDSVIDESLGSVPVPVLPPIDD